jgi:hypothetical protein
MSESNESKDSAQIFESDELNLELNFQMNHSASDLLPLAPLYFGVLFSGAYLPQKLDKLPSF